MIAGAINAAIKAHDDAVRMDADEKGKEEKEKEAKTPMQAKRSTKS
jgi:hypothetical protein